MSEEPRNNLGLWRSVEKTPPDMTKEVRFGKRHYTTVDPQWQMRLATSMWGPYGDKWGLKNLDLNVLSTHDTDGQGTYQVSIVVLQADFFYPHEGKEVSFEIANDDRMKVGDDTLKKLITNTRSKALSWLGFSADVFLGKFDDTAYVRDLKAKFGDQGAFANTIGTAIRTAKDLGALDKCRKRLIEIITDKTLEDSSVATELLELLKEREQELSV